jgi:eukaryotic-like serine/threonine-protein kinase
LVHHPRVSPVSPGDILAGKYRVTKVLGIGGMGVVVAATHMQLDEPVAIKFMLPEALGSDVAVERFLREARAAVKLKSEHVAKVSDVGTLETGAPYIVMEYLDGTDLSGVLESRGTLPHEEAIEYLLQAADGLAEAHALGIVHRDLKPANLFLTRRRDGTPLVKVLDFGISKSSTLNEQGAGALTKTGGIMGSPLYMSPEQMKSAKDTDARTDIWALGVILYELLGGRAPFDSETLGGLMALVLTAPPPPLANVRAGLPPGLYAVVGRCLEKDRDARWPTVAHFAAALEPFAPARARPLVERISIVLGQSRASMAAPQVGVAATVVAPRVGTGTAAAWTEGTGVPQKSQGHGGAIAAAVVAGILVLAGAGFVALKYARPHDAPVAAAPSSSPVPQAPSASTPPLVLAAATTSTPPAPSTAAQPPPSAPPPTVAAAPARPGAPFAGANGKKAPPSAANAPASPPPTPAAAPPPAAPKSQGGILDTSN